MARAFLKRDPRQNGKTSKSTKSAGQTAVAHTRAWIGDIHPGSLILEASKKVGRFPGGKDSSGETIWINRTVEEDIFGVFDLCVFPVYDVFAGNTVTLEPVKIGVELIQATTIGRDLSAVRARQSKVGNWIRNTFPKRPPRWLGDIYVVGWVPRKHLRIWRWVWEQMDAHTFGGWQEQSPAAAKLPKPGRSAPATDSPLDLARGIPF